MWVFTPNRSLLARNRLRGHTLGLGFRFREREISFRSRSEEWTKDGARKKGLLELTKVKWEEDLKKMIEKNERNWAIKWKRNQRGKKCEKENREPKNCILSFDQSRERQVQGLNIYRSRGRTLRAGVWINYGICHVYWKVNIYYQ